MRVVQRVQRTDDESCLASKPTSTPGSVPTFNLHNPTETTSNNSPPGSTLFTIRLIVGLVVGGCALVTTISAVAFFCLKRRRSREPDLWSDLTYDWALLLPTSYLFSENYTFSPFAPSATHLDAVPLPPVTTYHDSRYSQACQSIHRHDSHRHSIGSFIQFRTAYSVMNLMTCPSLMPVPYNYMPFSSTTAQDPESK